MTVEQLHYFLFELMEKGKGNSEISVFVNYDDSGDCSEDGTISACSQCDEVSISFENNRLYLNIENSDMKAVLGRE